MIINDTAHQVTSIATTPVHPPEDQNIPPIYLSPRKFRNKNKYNEEACALSCVALIPTQPLAIVCAPKKPKVVIATPAKISQRGEANVNNAPIAIRTIAQINVFPFPRWIDNLLVILN